MANTEYEKFLNSLTLVKETAALQGGYVTQSQLDEAFPDMNDEQTGFIKDYLTKNHIGIDEPIDAKSFMSESEINLFDMYMESLEDIDRCSDSVKRVLMMEAISGNKESKEKLMKQYLESVVDTAKLYLGQGADLMDLIGEGNVALAIAMEEIACLDDPDDVEPLIMKMIMNAMEELIGEVSGESDAEKKALDVVQSVTEKAKEMANELLRKVSVDELAAESGLSKNKIHEAMRLTKDLNDYIENTDNN